MLDCPPQIPPTLEALSSFFPVAFICVAILYTWNTYFLLFPTIPPIATLPLTSPELQQNDIVPIISSSYTSCGSVF